MNPTSSAFTSSSGYFSVQRQTFSIHSIQELSDFSKQPLSHSFVQISIHEYFTKESINAFIYALYEIKCPITSLDLSNSLIGDDMLAAILNALSNHPNLCLAALNLSNTGLTNHGAEAICVFLKNRFNKQIYKKEFTPLSLDLSINSFMNEGVVNLVKTAAESRVCHLSLARNYVSDKSFNDFFSFIAHGEISGDLDLRGNVLSEEVLRNAREQLQKTSTRLLA